MVLTAGVVSFNWGDALGSARESAPSSGVGPSGHTDDGAPPEPTPALDALARDVATLRATLATRGQEVDALQVQTAKAGRPWYREPAVLVAALALAASVVATILSQANSSAQSLDQKRTRLTAALNEISALQDKSDELAAQYGDKAPTQTITSLTLLAHETDELSEQVAAQPFELLVIAQTYYQVNDLDNALRVAREAKATARNPLDLVEANRTIARAHFRAGNSSEGRAAFQENDGVRENPNSALYGFVKTQYKFENEYNWTFEELYSGSCGESIEHATRMTGTVQEFPRAQQPTFAKRALDLGNQVQQSCT